MHFMNPEMNTGVFYVTNVLPGREYDMKKNYVYSAICIMTFIEYVYKRYVFKF